MTLFLRVIVVLACLSWLPAYASSPPQNVGFYYGHESPIGPLYAYDWLVLQPDQTPDARITLLAEGGTRPLAYVAVDEIAESDDLFAEVNKQWVIGRNHGWASTILDVRKAAVRHFLMDKRIAPAMARGFQGLFLDTLDSHMLSDAGKSNATDFASAQVSLINDIRARFPDAVIVINRGFHLPASTYDQVDALAFESYFSGYAPGAGGYRQVSEDDRKWLDAQLEPWRTTQPGKPVIAIDYTKSAVDGDNISRRLRDKGFTPVVSNHSLDRLSPTLPESIKRQVLVLHDLPPEQADQSQANSRLGVILEYLGLVPVLRSALEAPPTEPVNDRYHGVVVWWEAGTSHNRLCQWLSQNVQGQMPLVLIGLPPGRSACQRLVSPVRMQIPAAPLEVSTLQDSVGRFEGKALPSQVPLAMVPTTEQLSPWVRIKDKSGREYSPLFTRSGGGVALAPFLFEHGPDNGAYWLFDPVRFLKSALNPGPHPGIDATTESGRRIVTAHIDGDGSVSRARMPGTPQAMEVIQDEVIKHYALPHTVSVIEAEVSPDGVYPKESTEALATARRIFREPNVEIASHTFSHPFFWRMMEGETKPSSEQAAYGYSMDIPGYKPDLAREISGSLSFMKTLAPEGKPVRVFLWSGDARPGEKALRMVREAGLLNVNGGNTQPLKYGSTLAAVWPDARLVGDELQVHAPVLNENVYTNLWTGPFYGYRNVRESFDLLESPYRLKPSGIYYHFYSGTYPESLKALHEVYQHVLSQPNTPLYLSEYATRVQSRYYSAMMLTGESEYRWRGAQIPTTVSLSNSYFPDLEKSRGVAGFTRHGQKRYVYLIGHDPALVISTQAPEGAYLESANAPLSGWKREKRTDTGWRMTLSAMGHAPLEFRFKASQSCRVVSDHRVSRVSPVAFSLKQTSVSSLIVECE